MSFDVTNKSGEVVPLDPVDFLQFTGIAGIGATVGKTLSQQLGKIVIGTGLKEIRTPLGGITSGQTRKIITESEKLGAKTAAKPGGILEFLKNFFTKGTSIPTRKAAIVTAASGATGAGAVAVSKPVLSTSSKALIGTGLVAVPATAGILSLTPGGQEIVKVGGNVATSAGEIGKTITRTFSENPLILLALIGLGVLVIIKK